ncbi:MAG: hypothetical protein HRU21_09965 [Pseudomonadales bacterium]|nr:hypothetical protein [Pseudomonadales bacterium]
MIDLNTLHWQTKLNLEPQYWPLRIDEICQISSRQLCIRAESLPNALFSREDVLATFSSFVRYSRHRSICLLIDRPELLLKDDSDLLKLQRRLSSSIQIRKPQLALANPDRLFVISDHAGFISQPLDAEEMGFYSFEDKVNTLKAQQSFQADWQRAEPSRILRQLSAI